MSPNEGMRGLGDLVKKGTEAIGIKQKKGCGCGKRQDKLNKLFPFKKTASAASSKVTRKIVKSTTSASQSFKRVSASEQAVTRSGNVVTHTSSNKNLSSRILKTKAVPRTTPPRATGRPVTPAKAKQTRIFGKGASGKTVSKILRDRKRRP